MDARKEVIRAAIWITAFFSMAFLLNFFWEALHGVYLYQGHDMQASRYVPMLVYVSSVDGALVLAIYGFIAIVRRNILWIRNLDISLVAAYMFSAILLAGWIEFRAVYLTRRWDYLPEMPTVLGLGISPLLQLAVTGVICVGVTKRLFYPDDPDS